MALAFANLKPAAKVGLVIAGLAVAAAAWLFLTSTIFVVGTGLWKVEHKLPFLEAYAYWQAYPNDPRVLKWVKISAVGASLVLGLIAVAFIIRRPHQPLHGATGFAGRRELNERFRTLRESILCGRAGDYLRFGTNQHVALYAPTDSGKGVSVVIPNALLWDGSGVYFDTKKEIFRLTAGVRAYCGQEVHLFDPLDQDGRTARYNPFTYVKRGTVAAFDDVQRIGQVLFPATSGDEDFWRSAARSAFNGVAALLAETPELPFTIGEVFRTLTRPDGPEYLREKVEARIKAKRPYSQPVLSALADYLKASENLVNSVRKTVTARLELWNNPLIDAATAKSDFDLRDLRKRLMSIYVGVSPDNTERLRPLLTLFFQQMLDIIAQQGEPRYNPLLRRKLLVLLDEFPLLGKMEKIADAFAWVRSYGVRFLMVIQSKSQLRDTYGPERARTIFENCGAEIVFGTSDPELTREISERLGYNTVSAVSRSRPGSLLSNKGHDSTTTSDQRRALMLPQEIRTLDSRKCIVVSPGTRPILADRIVYYEDSTFTRLLMAAPEIQPIAERKEVAPARPAELPDIEAVIEPRPIPSAPEPPPEAGDRGRPAPVASVADAAPAATEAVAEVKNGARKASSTTRARRKTRPPQTGPVGESPAAREVPSDTMRDVAAEVTANDSLGTASVSPANAAIWDIILAAKPDLAKYGLRESEQLMGSIVGRLPGAEPERTLVAGE